MLDISVRATQKQFGELVGISQQAVSELIARGVLSEDASLGAWLLAYCGNLREVAAGRAALGDLDLAGERARLASEQADRIAMQNAQTRGELAPVALIEEVLAKCAGKIAGILEAIPGMVRRRSPALGADQIALIAGEIAKARNIVAAMSLEDLGLDDGSAYVCTDEKTAETR